MKKLLCIFLVLIISGCISLPNHYSELTPTQIETLILGWTPYNHVIRCRQRAVIAKDYLERAGYKVWLVNEKLDDGEFHTFPYWQKNGKEGYILKQGDRK